MALKRLEITNLRCLAQAELELHPRINLLVGSNGSGKTSILEAAHLLGRGRSFRTRNTARLVRYGETRLQVFGELSEPPPATLGVAYANDDGTVARVDRQPVPTLASLSEALPLQVVDPGIHRLVEEGPGNRRRWLDWGVFHVEPGYIAHWQQYRRALEQRAAALRNGHDPAPWEPELARQGEVLSEARSRLLELLRPFWVSTLSELLELDVHLAYYRGWSQDMSLADSLRVHRARDQEKQHTLLGPHRFDVLLRCQGRAAREVLSRGQQKLLGSAMALSMARLVAGRTSKPMLLLLDDPAAELDQAHAAALVEQIGQLKGQLMVTALDAEERRFGHPDRAFHVEQGRIDQLY